MAAAGQAYSRTATPLVGRQQTPPGPARPTYVLRGHSAAVHALQFIRSNAYLVSGDADGWVVVWDVATKRPAAVWRAHEKAILGLVGWGPGALITHGRDDRLYVWSVDPVEATGSRLSVVLPADDDASRRPQPWLLHALHVNTANFCALSACGDTSDVSAAESPCGSILIAVPSVLDSEGVDVFQLPSEHRVSAIAPQRSFKSGMVMALALFRHRGRLCIAAGYESGHTALFRREGADTWAQTYSAQPHSQPVLSLAVAPTLGAYYTSSADALIAKHGLASEGSAAAAQAPLSVLQTRHAGQQGLSVRAPDATLLATAGWDARVRVYASRSLKELAVLKWHSQGCYCTAFAEIQGAAPAEAERGGELVVREQGPVASVMERRRGETARLTHWLAAGSKDGNVSLWDIY
ncbi:MAG: hypothetical protein M1832_005302 [Thelocarpon impressellum]|nr:MAG: hypothetical protein M1832_005302 [Thelocarpon impressellum]